MSKRFISTVAVLIMILLLLSACNTPTDSNSVKYALPDLNAIDADTTVAENDRYELILDSDTFGISIKDKITGSVFGTTPPDDGEVIIDEFGFEVQRHPDVLSPLIINYYDKKANTDSRLVSYTAVASDGNVKITNIENGVRVEYYFNDAEIMVPVSYILKQDGVSISVNSKEITENENMLISVSLAPYFCSLENITEDSYLLYPSGSGTLIYPKELSDSGTRYEAEVYGNDIAKEKYDLPTNTESIRMPVFGCKIKDNALLAVIDKGSESAALTANVGSKAIGYSTVYTTFILRSSTSTIKELYAGTTNESTKYSDRMITSDIGISFYPLYSEKANYSGMAEKYVECLNTDNAFEAQAESATLNLTFVGGEMIEKSFLGVPYKTLYATSTIEQVNASLKALTEKGVKVSNVLLKGFGETGIQNEKLAGGFKIADKLGSVGQLNSLSDLCEGNGTKLYFDYDLIKFSKNGNGFNTSFDAAKRVNGKKLYSYIYDSATRSRDEESAVLLIKRSEIDAANKKLLSSLKYSENIGIGLSSLSSTAYSDFSNKSDSKYYSKGGMIAQTQKVYGDIEEAGRSTLSSNANLYAAIASKTVFDTPTMSALETVFDVDIPFYQMILRGRKEISVGSINLSSDSELEFLKAIESGAGMAFTLINSYDSSLLDSNYALFYSSSFEDNLETIISISEKTEDYYKKIGNSTIASHTILENGLRKTTFSNGTVVYVNFSDYDIASPDGTVLSKNFLVGENN